MSFKRLIVPITSSFTIGYSLAYFLYEKEIELVKPVHAATMPSQPGDLIPYPSGQMTKYSADDLTINKSARIGEMMKHGYPSLDNLRVFEDFVLSYDRRTRVPNWVFEHLTPAKMR